MRSTKVLPISVTVMLFIAMIAILGTVGTSPALAQDDTAMGNVPLWFQFNVGKVDDDKTSHVSVTLQSQAACSGGFQVFTSGEWGFWDTPTEGDWMGSATDIGYDMYMWAGELVPGAYYVRLGYGAQPGCVLGVSGQAVDYVELVDLGWNVAETEEPVAAPEQFILAEPTVAGADFKLVTLEPASTPSELPAASPAIAAASSAAQEADFIQVETAVATQEMDETETVPNVWMPVTDNEPKMFTFYVGNVPDEQNSSVSVTLYGSPFASGQFQIFTAEGVPYGQPEQDDWFGHSYTEDDDNPSWHGDLVPGVYYVRVEPQGMKDYLLAVNGEAVTF